MGGRNPPKNSWIASVELLQGIIRGGGGRKGGNNFHGKAYGKLVYHRGWFSSLGVLH